MTYSFTLEICCVQEMAKRLYQNHLGWLLLYWWFFLAERSWLGIGCSYRTIFTATEQSTVWKKWSLGGTVGTGLWSSESTFSTGLLFAEESCLPFSSNHCDSSDSIFAKPVLCLDGWKEWKVDLKSNPIRSICYHGIKFLSCVELPPGYPKLQNA